VIAVAADTATAFRLRVVPRLRSLTPMDSHPIASSGRRPWDRPQGARPR
jgi:hypothetical protein